MAIFKPSFTPIILFLALFPCFALSRGIYQYFQFVQQWPPNYCFDRLPPCRNPQQRFTIHGLWPSNYSRFNYNNRQQCQGNSFDYQMFKNQTLVNQLSNSWPEVQSGANRKFWKEQWDKHGKCSDQTFGQTQYFQRSYEIWKQFNITDTLNKAGIVSGSPPTKRNVTDIETRIQALIQVTPGLRCRRVDLQSMRQGQRQPFYVRLFYEVALCYDYGGRNLINCTNTQSKCSGSNVYF